MGRAIPEHIVRALVGGLVLSLSPGRLMLVHRVQLHFLRSWRIVVGWCCNRHHKKRPDSELRMDNSVRALSFVSTLFSLWRVWVRGMVPLPCITNALMRFEGSTSANASVYLSLEV